MTELEARALGELLQAIESRVNRLEEALELRGGSGEGWLSVGERLAVLEDPDAATLPGSWR
jgi:hypothetical protein